MRWIVAIWCCLLMSLSVEAQIAADDAVRIHEFYRLAGQIEDGLWLGWSHVPAPLMLVTNSGEFLTKFPNPPAGFRPAGEGFWEHPSQFPTQLQATFPLFGPPSVIVIGEPVNTVSRTSTPWEIVLMHEHFHQLQNAQPGYYTAVNALGLSGGDTNGMWMLNYPFPYAKPQIAQSFGALRDQLLKAVGEPDAERFRHEGKRYVALRHQFFAQLSPDDHKYLSFQLWQEGIARYMQIRAAEAAATYQPTAAYKALPDYEPFAEYAPKMRAETIQELRTVDIAKAGREAIYPFGAVEALFLDRWNPRWKDLYFKHLLTTDEMFELSTR